MNVILNIYYDMFSDFEEIKDDKFIYSGGYIDNIKHGECIYLFQEDKNFFYKRYYKCDKMNGKGYLQKSNGDKYEGDFKDDKMEGKGIFFFKNGDKYEGDFKDDKMEGKGIFFF